MSEKSEKSGLYRFFNSLYFLYIIIFYSLALVKIVSVHIFMTKKPISTEIISMLDICIKFMTLF